MSIRIGEAVSYKSPDDWQYVPDDRQQIVPLISGNTVQDYGWISSGDKMTCTNCLMEWSQFLIVVGYWSNRQLVTVVDEAGNSWQGCRVVIKKYGYKKMFSNYVLVDFEFWRI